MENSIRKRIDKLKELNGFENDNDIIREIFYFKKSRGEIGKIQDFKFIENNKGTYSKYFNGTRKIKMEDYLAIEYVLNTSMAYVIEGKGEIPDTFQPKGIRYAAFSDTIGNYEELMHDNIANSSDEYNKTLIDYMIEFKSKNGFEFFAERDLIPLSSTGGYKLTSDCLSLHYSDNARLLRVLCEILPIHLLTKYFDGFDHRELVFFGINETQNTSFSDDVISIAITRADLRKELAKCKTINLDEFNKGIRRLDGKSFGEGVFVNYGLTIMIKYALMHDVDDEIRTELLESAVRVNEEVFKYVSTFNDDELIIDKTGYLTGQYNRVYYGSIAIGSEINVEISERAKDLLQQLNRQVHDYHEYISRHSKISVFDNVIFADKKDNHEYYDFFKLMNRKGIKFVPLLKESKSKDKDMFEVSNSEKSTIASAKDKDLEEILKAIKQIDDISIDELNGMTYFLKDPSIYMLDGEMNYIMPKDIVISSKYSNLVRFLNENPMWFLYENNNTTRMNRFITLLKLYGLKRDELDVFFDSYKELSDEQAKSIAKTDVAGKETALKILKNKVWLEIYQDSIAEKF